MSLIILKLSSGKEEEEEEEDEEEETKTVHDCGRRGWQRRSIKKIPSVPTGHLLLKISGEVGD